MNISVYSFNKYFCVSHMGQALVDTKENETSSLHGGVHSSVEETGQDAHNYRKCHVL